jgi:hypothetical protein
MRTGRINEPGRYCSEIVENFKTALELFREIAEDLNQDGVEG